MNDRATGGTLEQGRAASWHLAHRASDYRRWRDAKLAQYPTRVEELMVEVRDPRALSANELRAMAICCRRANMCIYVSRETGEDKSIPWAIARQCGIRSLDANWLADDDAISRITKGDSAARREHIPYTDRAMGWHTDGAYNDVSRLIRSMVLHCVRPGAIGGENGLVDQEMVYLLMREYEPAFVGALSAPDAMQVNARHDEHGVAREDCSGPVFVIDQTTGRVYMRYTARRASVRWRADEVTKSAIDWLQQLLAGQNVEHPLPLLTVRLEAGMGIVCANVLHRRGAFTDLAARPRLLYRARSYDELDFGSHGAGGQLCNLIKN